MNSSRDSGQRRTDPSDRNADSSTRSTSTLHSARNMNETTTSSHDSSRAASVRQHDIPVVLRRMLDMRLIKATRKGEEGKTNTAHQRDPDLTAVVYDIDALRVGFASVRRAFPPHWKHCLAIKSCPLACVIEEALTAGLGVEAASFVELHMALAHGCPPDMVAFDSPAKTNEELEMALLRGTLINANSLEELDRIDAILQRKPVASTEKTTEITARVGLRLNPLVGAGAISELSVSVPTSKFAVPATPSNILKVVEAFRRWPWLVALHTHVGSQGCSLDLLAKGIATLHNIAEVVDGELGKGRVHLLDIGGGLPANYHSDEVTPKFEDYAAVLRQAVPALFENTGRIVVTEFGRALVAKTAFTVSTIEYVRRNSTTSTKSHEGRQEQLAAADGDDVSSGINERSAATGHQTLVTHMGADLFLRTSYCPGTYAHRLSMYGNEGEPLSGSLTTTDVAGPLCFQGDYLARGLDLPKASVGDLVVAHDTGANTLALFSRHCSRRSPAVYGYTRGGDGEVDVRLLKDKETIQDVARFWGTR